MRFQNNESIDVNDFVCSALTSPPSPPKKLGFFQLILSSGAIEFYWLTSSALLTTQTSKDFESVYSVTLSKFSLNPYFANSDSSKIAAVIKLVTKRLY